MERAGARTHAHTSMLAPASEDGSQLEQADSKKKSCWSNCFSCCSKKPTQDGAEGASDASSETSSSQVDDASSPKWELFKDVAPKSVSSAFLDFAIAWKNEKALEDKGCVMKGVTWIAHVAISTFAIPVALIEGVARTALNLIVSFLATVSPWGTEKLNELNENYFSYSLVNHVIVVIVAAKSAFTGLFSPKAQLAMSSDVARESYVCRKLSPDDSSAAYSRQEFSAKDASRLIDIRIGRLTQELSTALEAKANVEHFHPS